MVLDVLTSEQVAEALGCEAEHVNYLASSHKLPGFKFGRSWRFSVAALNKFLEARALENVRQVKTEPMPQIKQPKSRRTPVPDFTQLVRVSL